MSPDVVGVLVGSITVAVLGALYLISEGSRRVDEALAPVETEHDQAEQRSWEAHDAALRRVRQRAELRQRQAADLEEWRRELGWTKR